MKAKPRCVSFVQLGRSARELADKAHQLEMSGEFETAAAVMETAAELYQAAAKLARSRIWPPAEETQP